jgi:hypothetical protein
MPSSSCLICGLVGWVQGARLDAQRALADERVAKEMVQERIVSLQQVSLAPNIPGELQLTMGSLQTIVQAAVRHGERLTLNRLTC